ncbi:type II secretion system F family protein [Luteimonas sp. MHLX1A]|uniref:type II secretion system F family protein n=1 Tax=Alterluteimonas muca TaxID=2878684 RepID=UPI001E324363|nr:type II secretion system F family protein [Luteimonas sp. MHLX1A]MCD9046735.1 type II secretion system F family protein [Luteimonas sp. MHLX1A]
MNAISAITDLQDRVLGGMSIEDFVAKKSFGVPKRLTLYRQIRDFVKQGQPPYGTINRIVEVGKKRLEVRPGLPGIADRISNVLSSGKRGLKGRIFILEQTLADMDEGKQVADALSRWIPREEGELLRTGEATDRLVTSLDELDTLLTLKADLSKAIWSAVLGLLVRMGVLVGMMAYILGTVLSEVKGLVSDDIFDKLMIAPAYFSFGNAFLQYGPVFALFLVVVGVVVAVSLPRWRPDGIRRVLDHSIAPYTLYGKLQSATMLLSASAMLESGRQFRESLNSVRSNSDPWLKTHAQRALRRLNDGNSDAESLQIGMLSWELEDELRVYAMQDDFKKVLRAIAESAMRSVLNSVKTMANVMNVISMLLLAAFILSTVFAIGEIAMEAQTSVQNATKG